MKITQIMLAKGFGGAERYFMDLSLAISELGHELQIIHHKRFRGAHQFAEIGSITVNPVTVFGNWDIYAVRRIKTLIKSFSPDIVHAHLARASHIAGKSCHDIQVPLVVKTHNYVNLKYYQYVDMFITTTNDQKDYLIRHHIDALNVSVIPNFSSLNIKNIIFQPENTSYKVVAYGRMVSKKGFDILLKSFRKVVDQGIHAELIIGGEGPEYNKLLKLSTALDLKSHVTFYGWVDDVNALLEEADLFVLPSLDEPFGIAILEAMARGVPIISTRTLGPLEILDQNTAILIEIGDVDSLAQNICKAINDQQGSFQRARLAQEKFKTTYAKDVVVPELINLYKKVIASI